MAALCALGVALPFGVLILSALSEGLGGLWQGLSTAMMRQYIANTLILLVSVGGLSFLLGVGTAALVVLYDFPGRRWLGGLLFLPLALPAYLLAYTYIGIFEVTGPVESFLRWVFGTPVGRGRLIPFEMMSLPGLIVLLTVNLYPYVFMTARTAFVRQSAGAWEAARSLGLSPWRAFWKVLLPMTRPAWVGGLILCLLEVINDYGAAEFYGVDTFATGIFREWFGRGNEAMAVRLAVFLLAIVGGFFLLERWQRGQARYDEGGEAFRPILRQPLTGVRKWAALGFCLGPVLAGFVFPVLQLLGWAWQTGRQALEKDFFATVGNSLGLAFAASCLTVVLALGVAYTARIFPRPWVGRLTHVALIGYSIPGTVTAVGMMVVGNAVDQQWLRWFPSHKPWVIGSFSFLLAAFAIRFLLVAFSPIDGSFHKTGRSLHEASRLLGRSPLATLWYIEIPLLRASLLGAFLMVFIDALKELPLTLFLRWSRFETFSTKIYNFAKTMEVAEDAAPYALVLVFFGLLPVLGLERLLSRR